MPEIVAFLVVGNGSDPNAIYKTFNTETRNIIEWDDKDTEICLVVGVKSGKGYKYYSQKEINIEAETQSAKTENFSTNTIIGITIYKISPKIKEKNYYRTTKNVTKEKYEHWVNYKNTYYEYIEYEDKVIGGMVVGAKGAIACKNLSQIQKDKGTFFYAFTGTIKIDGKERRFDLPVLDIKNLQKDEKELENQLKKYYLVIPNQTCEKGKDIQCAGLITLNPEKVLKISRKSDFSKKHEKWCKGNEMGCKIIETAESYYGVPYVEGVKNLQKIKIEDKDFDVSDLGLAADCGAFANSVLEYNGLEEKCLIIRDQPLESILIMGEGWKETGIANGVYVGDVLEVPRGVAFVYSDMDDNNYTLKESDELISMAKTVGTVDVKTIKELRGIWTDPNPIANISTFHRRTKEGKCFPLTSYYLPIRK
jgi:hypothetical protein